MIRAGKFFSVGFFSWNHRNSRIVDGEIGIDVQHLAGFEFGFFASGVGGVALLPIKFEGTQEKFGAQLPADDAVPLVHEHGQVAVGLNPLRPHVPDDGFGCWANDQGLGQLLAAADGDDRKLRRETFHMMLFFIYEAARNEHGERDVLVAGGFEATVERLSDVFPQRPAVRTHDHTAAHRGVVGKLSFQDELVVPLREIFCAGRELFFSHAAVDLFSCSDGMRSGVVIKKSRSVTTKRNQGVAHCQRDGDDAVRKNLAILASLRLRHYDSLPHDKWYSRGTADENFCLQIHIHDSGGHGVLVGC